MTKTFRVVPAIVFLLFSLVLADRFRVHGKYTYDDTFNVDLMEPSGNDFRWVYVSAKTVLRDLDGYAWLHNNVYLPGVSVLYIPLTFLDIQTAYEVFTLVLMAALWGAAYLALSLGVGGAWTAGVRSLLALLVTAIVFHTYPGQFSIERGNFDLLALVSMAAAIYFSLFRPLASAAFVGLAVVLKVYPILILPALIRRISPGFPLLLFGIVVLGLVCLGPVGIREFIARLEYTQQAPLIAPLNHSMVSFFAAKGWPRAYVPYVLIAMLVPLSLASFLLYFRDNPRPVWKLSPKKGPLLLSEVCLIGACVSFMGLAVGTSIDYKLVIQFFPFLLALGVRSESPKREGVLAVVFCLIGICLAWCLHLDRSVPRTPWIIGLFVLYLVAVAIEEMPGMLARHRKPRPLRA